MSSPVTEVVTFKTTDSVKADPSLPVKLFRDLSGSAGVLQHAIGARVEEPEKWQLFIDRESLEHHKKAQSVADIQTKAEKLLTTPPTTTHVSFSPYDGYVKSLAAPVTEIIFATLKDNTDAKVFKEINDASLVASVDDGGCVGWAWGHTIENEKAVVLVIGWNSIEDHKKFVPTESFRRTTEPWLELVAAAKPCYVKFSQ